MKTFFALLTFAFAAALVAAAEPGHEHAATYQCPMHPWIKSDKPDAKCVECTDARKDQPVQGMTILRDIKPDADDKATWVGGDILDPNNGKVYKVRLKLADAGKKLEVRGYIGTPLLGRTQTWLRVQ